jgi:hypothetical protein
MATLGRPGALLADAFRRILDDLDLAQHALVPTVVPRPLQAITVGCSQTLLDRGHDETRDGHPLGNGWAGIQTETGPPCVHQDRR